MSKKFFKNYFQNQINLINFDNNTVNKLTFSSDTSTSTFTVTWTDRSFLSAVNSPTNGYFGGGYVSSNTWSRQITKIQFTNK